MPSKRVLPALRGPTPFILVLLAACGGGRVAATGDVAPAEPPAAVADRPVSGGGAVAVAAAADADVADTLAAPGGDDTLAAVDPDSAADAEVLEELRAAAPADGDAGGRTVRTSAGGAEASDAGAAVTWDIDVTSFLSHERVQYYLDFFQGPARERFGAWLQRMPRYEPMIRARLAQEGLPGDLLYLALIESGFSNSATSRARAVGMWQFMPGTGRQYGLRVDRWEDDRRDPVKATDAAARHLRDLRDKFGSLYLAAAAYNAGGGKVSRGLRRLGDAEAEDDAEDLTSDSTFFLLYDTRYLRRETKDYVPKLIAAALIAKEPERYGFPRPEAVAPFAYDSIVVPDATGLDVLARLAGASVTALRELNPQFLRLITPPGARAVVRLPVGAGARTVAAYAELPAARRVTFKEHVVRKGETLGHLARRYGVAVADIRSANRNIAPNRLRIGMTLIIPVSPAFDARAVAAAEARPAPAARPAGRVTWHRVRSGESWWSISRRYGVRLGDLLAWNDAGARDKLRVGQRIRVATGRAAPAAASRAARPVRLSTASRPPTYRVRSGDTLSGIAAKYGMTVADLRRLNRLGATSVIRTGGTLKLR